jgi:peptidyl-dipeptidase Dcp
MAQNPEKYLFLNDLLEKRNQLLKKEFVQLTALKELDGIEQLEKWDGAYYSEN